LDRFHEWKFESVSGGSKGFAENRHDVVKQIEVFDITDVYD
jgi:hypothetical protein